MPDRKPYSRWRRSTAEQQEIAKVGYDWLKNQRLDVVLIPAPEPTHHDHKIRSVVEHNPPWYSRMAKARGMDKHMHRGGSLRFRTLRALQRLIDGWFHPCGLEEEILDELGKDLAEQGWKPNAR